jgi:hypothetical protein
MPNLFASWKPTVESSCSTLCDVYIRPKAIVLRGIVQHARNRTTL